MGKKNLEASLKEFKELLDKKLQAVLKNTIVLGITKADKKFIRLYQTAYENDMDYGVANFRSLFNKAADTFNGHYNERVETHSNLTRIGKETRIDINEVLRLEGAKNDKTEEKPYETIPHPN